jgi:hypothetical protein
MQYGERYERGLPVLVFVALSYSFEPKSRCWCALIWVAIRSYHDRMGGHYPFSSFFTNFTAPIRARLPIWLIVKVSVKCWWFPAFCPGVWYGDQYGQALPAWSLVKLSVFCIVSVAEVLMTIGIDTGDACPYGCSLKSLSTWFLMFSLEFFF